MDVYETVEGGRTALEKLTDIIPGWKGYQERQTRRKADKTMREMLADKIATQRKRLDTAQQSLIDSGKIDLVDDLGRAVTQLQTFADRVRLATYGYSGVFDAVKIKQEQLEQLYNFDAALFDYVDRLNTANDRLREAIDAGQGVEETIRIIQDMCREANAAFDEREHVLLGSQ